MSQKEGTSIFLELAITCGTIYEIIEIGIHYLSSLFNVVSTSCNFVRNKFVN